MRRGLFIPSAAIRLLISIIVFQAFNACDKSDPLSSNSPIETSIFKTIEHNGLEESI